MSKLQNTIIGGITGLLIVGVSVLLISADYRPNRVAMVDISPAELFFKNPYFWTLFGIPFGAIISLIGHSTLNNLRLNWRIAKVLVGGVSGFAVTVGLFVFVFFVWICTLLCCRDSFIISYIILASLYLWIGLLNLFIPGAIIGAIVGLLFQSR